MKKNVFLTIICLFFIGSISAQLSFADLEGNPIENDAVLTFNTEHNFEFVLTNNSDESIEVFLTAVSIDRPDGSFMDFCFGQLCYGDIEEGARYPNTAYIMEAGASTPSGDHFMHHLGSGGNETATYVIKFYQEGNTSNYVQFTYKYDPDYTAVEDEFSSKPAVSVYPNPSRDFFYVRTYDFDKDYQIVIRNVIGKEVKNINIKSSDEIVKVQTDDLTSGIYLYTVLSNGQFIETKKLIISK